MASIITLNQFIKDHHIKRVDYIKIDTEGYELEVIEGADELINKLRPKIIQIEFNWHQLFKGQTIYSLSQKLPD